ncbi:hypothetical protein GB931_03510 [Modestobacter sp. I12A-02628]|uniref:DUF2383 domain-containing protein n=1 Tax=Goekera deserti TaxID=2497753 RepID=A0A7K3WEB9_9ACTN|nr:hypothetical protein [Goekera deserti]MPQ97005.1 hypothetical protein [Goekera deserti]NDI46680.1 hypothetical protein [Goekera deserti]NEL54249.1 hypothetical protein [Goekera deserti]
MPAPAAASPTPAGEAARNRDLLGIYCNDHLASASGGVELVRRVLAQHDDGPWAADLRQLLAELREERAALQATVRALGLPVRGYKQVAVWVGEKLARGKLNGRLLSRSPLSSVVEFEFLTVAVLAKRSGFETLRALADVEPRVDAALFDRLIDQADRQHRWLATARRQIAADVFGGDPWSAEAAADT